MFVVHSESEQSQGYADIYLEPVIKEAQYRFIIEFKYIKSNELNKKSSIIEKTQERAKQQVTAVQSSIFERKYKMR